MAPFNDVPGSDSRYFPVRRFLLGYIYVCPFGSSVAVMYNHSISSAGGEEEEERSRDRVLGEAKSLDSSASPPLLLTTLETRLVYRRTRGGKPSSEPCDRSDDSEKQTSERPWRRAMLISINSTDIPAFCSPASRARANCSRFPATRLQSALC